MIEQRMFISSGDERGFYRAELQDIRSMAVAALPKTTDRTTRIHLESVRDQIDKILDPKETGRTGSGAAVAFIEEQLQNYYNPTSCWYDYAIKP